MMGSGGVKLILVEIPPSPETARRRMVVTAELQTLPITAPAADDDGDRVEKT
jgi:hypothetical protein